MGVSNCTICVERDERSKRPLIWQRIPWGLCPLKCTPGKKQKPCIGCADRARCHLCCPDAASPATDERTSHILSRRAVGARYDRYRSVPSSTSISFVQTNRQRTRTGIFRANGAGRAPSEPRGARVLGAGTLCAHSRSKGENNVTNGSSGKSAKAMSGCARYTALARLSREACGCMSEIGGPICSRSAEACRATQTHFLVRAGKSRRVEGCEEEISYALTQARAFPSQASRPFEVPARHGHQARSTQLQLAFGQMTLLPPRNEPRASKDPVTVWVIRVWEEQAPEGEEALEWIRLPSVPTTTLEQAWERVEWYRHRWLVEDYHQCLKSGCRIEQRQGPPVEGLMRRLGSVVSSCCTLAAGACLRSGSTPASGERAD